jgi:cobalt-zinc-cadmium efflux system membrane fusion protein
MKNSVFWLELNYIGKRMKLIYAAVITVLAFGSCNKPQTENVNEKFSISDTMMKRIELSEVKNIQVMNQLRLIGKVTPDENKVIEVYPLVGGNVIEVKVELGDYVQKGEILATIRSSEAADFERQLVDAQSDLLMAEKNLNVAQDLYEGKLNSEREVLAAKKEKAKAEAELNRIKEVLTIYGINTHSEYVVKAPISGFIVEKKINRDMQLRSDNSDNIFTISQINDIWVLANVNETDISKIKEDFDADIETISYRGDIFKGKVDKIYNVLDPDTKTMKIRIKLDNPGYRLKPEMNATVTVNFSENEKMASVPSSAVIFDKSKNYVMIFYNRDSIETREVELYRVLNDRTYISQGVREGEKVISKNQLLIYDALND